MQLFLDMDGVLADFDTGYELAFGNRPDKQNDDVDWNLVTNTPNFYLNLPPMFDMYKLWDFSKAYRPIILTGIPSSIVEAPENKKAWVRKWLGPEVEVRCCKSRDKCLHASHGDILVDDWDKYKHLWEGKGGIWVTHKNADSSIQELKRILG